MELNPYESPKHFASQRKSLLVPWVIAWAFIVVGAFLSALSAWDVANGVAGRIGGLTIGFCALAVGFLAVWGLSRSQQY
jgi:hypothetical protein